MELFGAVGPDAQERYVARHAVALWLGYTLLGGAQVLLEDPPANTNVGK